MAGGHHGHGYRSAGLTNGANELAAHVAHLCKGVLHPGSGLGNARVALLPACAQGLVLLGLALDVFTPAQRLEHLAAPCAGVALVGIDITAGVVLVQDFIEVPAVVLAGGAGEDFADELVLHIHVDAELVAVVALAVLFGLGGVQVFLPALGLAPVLGGLALRQLFFLFLGEVLDGSGHQGGVDDLPAACNEPVAQQLAVHRLEQGRHAIDVQALLVVPDGVAIGDGGAVRQKAKALVTHAVKQLVFHLLVAQLVRVLEDQDAHHDGCGVRRASAFAAISSGQEVIDDLREVVKVDMPGNELQRIAQRFDLALARGIGKQVELDGSAGGRCAHRGIAWAFAWALRERRRVLEVPLLEVTA